MTNRTYFGVSPRNFDADKLAQQIADVITMISDIEIKASTKYQIESDSYVIILEWVDEPGPREASA